MTLNPDDTSLERALTRLNARAWGIAVGLMLAVGLAAATWILIAIGPAPGADVGQTLGQLRYFLPGYSVTPIGGVIGGVYGFVIGYAIGRVVGTLYNRLVDGRGQ